MRLSFESDRLTHEDMSFECSEGDSCEVEDSGLKVEIRPAEASKCQKYRRAKASESIAMSEIRGYTMVRI